MKKSLVALLLAAGATAYAANFALAQHADDVFLGSKLMNATMAKELHTRAAKLGTSATVDTTFVGFTPGHSANNYWSVWSGNDAISGTYYRPPAKGGNWDFEPPYTDVHGDSLQGWWSMRLQFFFAGGVTIQDYQRPWNCIDAGNEVNYAYGAAPIASRRTTGVVGAWHVDGGNTIVPPASTNWTAETDGGVKWAPLVGSSSAWMGLRRHGDNTYTDPITHNPFNEDVDWTNGLGSASPGGTDKKFPGYENQMDQMLYRDIDVSAAGDTSITVSFQYRTAMSTQFGTTNSSRRGWFQHDPLAVITGVPNANFISNQFNDNVDGPADSFMVYVGAPAEGSVKLSDGNTHTIYDPLRRWFGEVLRSNEGFFKEIKSVAGTNASTASGSITIPNSLISAWKAANAGNPAAANKIRLVFRVKTNSAFSDGDQNASAFSSGGVGAAIVDNVVVTTPSGLHNFTSGFESASEIDNTASTTSAWRSTGKPPASYYHIRQISPSTGLVYQDLCGAPGNPARICNLQGQIVSMGLRDDNEAAEGPPGTTEQDEHKGIFSPTINLSTGAGPNNMGLDGSNPRIDAVATDDYYLIYDIYTGVFDVSNQGNFWRFGTQSYPGASSATGVGQHKRWGDTQFFAFVLFNPDKQCFTDVEGLGSTIHTTNGSGIPDSLRIFLGTLSECFRFGVANSEQLGGGYFDNITLAIADNSAVVAHPIAIDIWQLYQDSFPSNDSPGFAGNPTAFDTTTALMKSGLGTAPNTNDLNKFDVPGDTTMVTARGDSVRMDLVFRILPGPGNYVSPSLGGNSQLKKLPNNATPVSGSPGSGSTNFWENYMFNNGIHGTPGGHPVAASGPLAGQKVWSPNVWNSARMDTAEINRFNEQKKAILEPGDAGLWMTAYHETELADPNRGALAITRNICFLADTAGAVTAILCGSGNTGGANYPPDWVTILPHSRTGWNGSSTTKEGTKIIPDGLLTPGSHVDYFFRRQDGADPTAFGLAPDTTVVTPQNTEGPNIDGHRWQEFAVLPDRWKSNSYTNPVLGTPGRGAPCMLYVDSNDRRGDERTWVGVADSIGATRQEKWGAHNGWAASGADGTDINDPAGFVYKHIGQAGTTWDMYQIKASESLDTPAGRLGSRGKGWYSQTDLANSQIDGKTSRQGPTLDMLQAYYKVILFLSGDLNSGILGPFGNCSANDLKILEDWLRQGNTSTPDRGFFAEGNGFVEATDDGGDGTTFLTSYLGVQLRDPSYSLFSGNLAFASDLTPTSAIPPSGNIYGVHNSCLYTLDVLDRSGALSAQTQEGTFYDPVGGNAPYIAGVVKHWDSSNNPWISLVDGWDIRNMASPDEFSARGRLVYFFNVFSNVFHAVCDVQGAPAITLDTPGNSDGRLFNFMSLANNPLRSGSATVNFGLAKSERVKIQIFDVSGRLVRTLADRSFTAGEHKLTWDGADNAGRLASRGVYFVRSQHADSKFQGLSKLIVLK